MKTINKLSGLVLLLGIAVVSCSKNDLIIPSGSSVNLKIQASSKLQPVARALLATGVENASANSFAWDTCLMVVSKIELEAEKHEGNGHKSGTAKDNSNSMNDGNSGEGKSDNTGTKADHGGGHDGFTSDSSSVSFEWRGPKKVDLFNLTAVTGNITLDPGTFNNVELKIQSFKVDAGSDPLFYLTGDYTNASSTVRRIKIIINEDFELKIKNLDTLSLGQNFTSLIKVNLVQLMSNISQAELDNADLTNGKLIISSTSNVALYTKVKTNFHESEHSEFEKD
jgi:hypothetical protein